MLALYSLLCISTLGLGLSHWYGVGVSEEYTSTNNLVSPSTSMLEVKMRRKHSVQGRPRRHYLLRPLWLRLQQDSSASVLPVRRILYADHGCPHDKLSRLRKPERVSEAHLLP
jgi:hypothetical protein